MLIRHPWTFVSSPTLNWARFRAFMEGEEGRVSSVELWRRQKPHRSLKRISTKDEEPQIPWGILNSLCVVLVITDNSRSAAPAF